MYELEDLKTLIATATYDFLEADDNAEYEVIKDNVETEINRYTNYTASLLSDEAYSKEKKLLMKPFAWILEYFCLSTVDRLTDLDEKRIFRNFKEATEILETFPSYIDPNGNGDFSSVYQINGTNPW